MNRKEMELIICEFNIEIKNQRYENARKTRDMVKIFREVIVDPLFINAEIIVKSINRERKINSILDDKKFYLFTIEETSEYKELSDRYKQYL
jgi:hypothetical protein